MEDKASPQGAQQDALVKISAFLMLSHAESCVLTARPKHLLHGGRRSPHTFGCNNSFSSGIMGCFRRPLTLCSLSTEVDQTSGSDQGQISSFAVAPPAGRWRDSDDSVQG